MSDVIRYTGSHEEYWAKQEEAHLAMVKERVRAFAARWGYPADALIIHPAALHVAKMRLETRLDVIYDPFCPRDEVYPVNSEAMRRQEQKWLEARIAEGHEAEAKLRALGVK